MLLFIMHERRDVAIAGGISIGIHCCAVGGIYFGFVTVDDTPGLLNVVVDRL